MNLLVLIIIIIVVRSIILNKDNNGSQGVKGVRFVKIIQQKNYQYLSLAEVQVFDMSNTNVALNKKPKQSSIDFGGSAKRAVDGNTDGKYSKNSVTHTNRRKNSPEYWEVNLNKDFEISKVVIYNRTDCCSSRILNSKVQLLDKNKIILKELTINKDEKFITKNFLE